MTATPTPGEMSARLLEMIADWEAEIKADQLVPEVARDPHFVNIREHDIARMRAALSALPAAGGAVAWPTEAKRAGDDWQARTALSTHTMGEAQAAVWNACRAACIAAHKRAATTPQPSAAEDGEERARRLYEPDEYEDAFKGRADAAVGAQGDGIVAAIDRMGAAVLAENLPAFKVAYAEARRLATPAAGKGVDGLPAKWRERIPAKHKDEYHSALRDAYEVAADELEAALTRQPVAGDGMVLVPREPSPEQVRAGTLAGILTPNQASAAYQAMLAAAPAATPTDGGEG